MRNSRNINRTPRRQKQKSSYEAGLRTTEKNADGRDVYYANNDIQCRAWNDRINMSVCITRNYRQPEKCKGCPLNY